MTQILGIIGGDLQQHEYFMSQGLEDMVRQYPEHVSQSIEFDSCSIKCVSHSGVMPTRLDRADSKGVVFGESNGIQTDTENVSVGSFNLNDVSGCFAAVISGRDRSITIAADPLGIFPIYYSVIGKSLIFSTQPTLITSHPQFVPSVSPEGLMGILLTMHITNNQTIYQNIKRLPAGHELRWCNGEARLLESNKVTASEDLFHLSESEIESRLNESLSDAVMRSADTAAIRVLLSGGLDSRILSGYLGSVNKSKINAVTLGDDSDLEATCARKVAKAQAWRHYVVSVDFSRFAEHALAQVKTEALSSGLNDLSWWQLCSDKRGDGLLVTGLFGDSVMGGSHIPWGYDNSSGSYKFSALFGKVNRWGLSPDLLLRLLRPSAMKDALQHAAENLEGYYDDLAGEDFQRVWLFDLAHRQRFHIGGVAHRLTAGSQVTHPFIDSDFVKLCSGVPEQYILKRRLQNRLLCERYPHLARLPMDRNSSNDAPLLPSLGYRIQDKAKRVLMRPFSKRLNGEERLYYYRVFDLNNPGWLAIRHAAEPYRECLYGLFDPKVLNELVPPPDSRVSLDNRIIDASGIKTILGLMMLMGSEYAPRFSKPQ